MVPSPDQARGFSLALRPGDGAPVWHHLAAHDPVTHGRLDAEFDLDDRVVEALTAPETEPRVVAIGDGLLIILRGVNLLPGGRPEDMVSLRLWVTREIAVSVALRRLMSVEAAARLIEDGAGPDTVAGLLVVLVEGLIDRASQVVQAIEAATEAVEVALVDTGTGDDAGSLDALERRTIYLRRFLSPQAATVERLATGSAEWIGPDSRPRLSEAAAESHRLVRALAAVREHQAVLKDRVAAAHDRVMQRTTFLLTIVAGVFLPLNFLAALFGANVGGIPLSDDPLGFVVLIAVSVVLAVAAAVAMRLGRWF